MTMSSTEGLSSGSVHDYNDSDNSPTTKSPRRQKRHSPKSSKKVISEEVQDEIDELLDNVPDLDTTFTIQDKIGAGTFSSVYVARLKNHPHVEQKFALKHIIPTSHPFRIENELRCLKEIGGRDNVMGVEACLRARDHVVIVMPYFPHDYFPDYIRTVTVVEVRDYMRALLVALRRVHADDIIHRDVKPTNFLVNTKLKKYALVDFGLAQKAPVPLKQGAGGRGGSRFTLAHIPSGSTTPTPTTTTPTPSSSQPTSPRRRNKLPPPTHSSPRKRKLRPDDAENFPESPSKRKAGGAEPETALAELDLNAAIKQHSETKKDSQDQKEECAGDGKRKSLTPTPAEMFQGAYNKTKSPRRMLLTKRALDMGGRAGSGTALNAKVGGQARTVVVQQAGRSLYKTVPPTACQCFSQAMVCNVCVSRSPQVAPRAGTPGFRAPEVLMKCPDQTTAVDMWSAGVIFLSLLSGRYPFFKADDDMTALAQITSILGTETMKTASRAYGKELVCNPRLPAVDLRVLCERLRSSSSSGRVSRPRRATGSEQGAWDRVPDSAFNLLRQMLDPNPHSRITANTALSHPFLNPS